MNFDPKSISATRLLIPLTILSFSVLLFSPLFSSYVSLVAGLSISFALSEIGVLVCTLLFLLFCFYLTNKTLLIASLLVFSSLFTPSPLLPAFTPLTGNYYYLLSAIFTLFLLRLHRSALVRASILYILSLALSLFPVVFWSDPKLIFLLLYLQLAFFISISISKEQLYIYCKIATWLCFSLLLGSLIGLIYVYLGGPELISLPNQDGRSNGLYLSTLSNSFIYGTIRPSGIYDEPGTLSFVVCIVVALREALNMPRKISIYLVTLGFLTFSVAHVIFSFLYLLYCQNRAKWSIKRLFYAVLISSLIICIVAFTPLNEIFQLALFNRIQIVNGALVADNRSALFFNSLGLLNTPSRILFGIDSACITNISLCITKGYPQFGDNPLAPLVLYGFFNSLPYYSFIGCFLYLSMRRKNILILAIVLLCLIKNEIYSFGYALIISIYLRSLIQSSPIRSINIVR